MASRNIRSSTDRGLFGRIRARSSFLSSTASSSQNMDVKYETAALPSPPVARREEDRFVLAGKVDDGKNRGPDESLLVDPPRRISDPYGWMRDESRTNEEILNHLNSENAYTKKLTSHLGDLQDKMYNEFLSSIKETDYTTPAEWGNFVYYSRTFEGKSYKTLCRAPKTANAAEVAQKVRSFTKFCM